jgi:hypothetical protein
MFAMGIAVIIIPDQTWQMYFIIIGIVGLAVNAATVIGNEFSSKWGKYKLTLPVKRIDIVKSLYINQLLWIMIGVFFGRNTFTELHFLLMMFCIYPIVAKHFEMFFGDMDNEFLNEV